MQQRPTGVTILAVLAAIGGVFGLLGGIALLSLGGVFTIIAILAIVSSILSLAFAYGAWTLQPWAWTLGIAGQVLSILTSIFNVTQGTSVGSVIVSIAISAAIIYYLMTPDVKRAFGRA